MNTVLERSTLENVEMEKHNAMINERYRKLLDMVEDQLSAPIEKAYEPVRFAPQAPSFDVTPTLEQAPTVTEYAPVLTVEEVEEIKEISKTVQVPVADTQVKAVVKVAPTAVAHYSLTPFAKLVMAAFTLVVVAMLVLIGINSQLMQQRSIRLKNLEEQRQELMERSEELQLRIQELQTEASILERAEAAGLLN